MMPRRLFALSVLLVVWFGVGFLRFGWAKVVDVKVGKEEGPIEIEAEELSYDRAQQTYYGHGSVVITRGDFNLQADHVLFRPETNELQAWGNVLMSEGEDVLECERLEVNVETRTGKVFRAKLFLKDNNYHVAAEEAEKLGENEYRIRQGSFTTCDARKPPWKFAAQDLYVRMGGEGIVHRARFYLADIPVFYFPWASVPLRKERQTGFLMPQVGLSSKYGPEVKTGFYWAMTKEMDSTFYLDYLGDRGFKEGLEYRYALGRETDGEARVYFIDDRVFEGKRYAFFLQNRQELPYDFYLKGNVNYVSEWTYLRDFEDDLPERSSIDARTVRQLRSVLFGGRNWDSFTLLAEGDFFRDMAVKSNDETIHLLPRVGFYGHPQSLWKTPIYADLTSSYTYFTNKDGNRLGLHRWDLFPRFFYPGRFFDVLKFEPSVGFRETYYRSDDDRDKPLKKGRETLEATATLSTEFYRVYDGTAIRWLSDLFNVTRWMHTVEPTLEYRYRPRVDEDELPLFDDIDRQPFTHEVTYGLTQRMIGKPQREKIESGPYEYAMLRVYQSYSLGDPYMKDGKKRDFSSVFGEMAWRFNPYLFVRWIGAIDPYRMGLDEWNTLIRAKDRRNDALQIEYRYTKDQIQTINVHTRLKTVEPLYLYGGIRYNLQFHTRVENIVGAEYQAQCWTLGFNLEDKNRSPDGLQRKEVRFQLYFHLLGLGGLGQKPKLMSF